MEQTKGSSAGLAAWCAGVLAVVVVVLCLVPPAASAAEPQRSAGKFQGDYNRWFSGELFDFEEVPVSGFVEVRPFILNDNSVMVAWKAVQPKGATKLENIRIAPREARNEANTLNLFVGESKKRINTGWVDWDRVDLAQRLIANPGSFHVTMLGQIPSRVPNASRTAAVDGETPYQINDGSLIRGKRIVKLRKGLPPEKLKTASKLVRASEKFPEYAARIRWSKTGAADRLLSLTDQQVELARGAEFNCWIAGGGITGALAAAGRLNPEVVGELNMLIDSLKYNIEGDYCKSLLTAVVGYLTAGNAKASKKAKCKALAIRVQVAADGLALVLPDLPAPELKVGCKNSKKKTVLKARTLDGSPLQTVAPKLGLGVGSTDNPKRKPKAKVKAKQK